MNYKLNELSGDGVQVPLFVINRIPVATENATRIALYILQQGTVDRADIMSTLKISSTDVETAFAFWLGAGLLSYAEIEQTPSAPSLPLEKPRRLTAREIVSASKKNPDIAILMEESQNLFGEVLAPSDSSILASLYINDALPVDLILLGIGQIRDGAETLAIPYFENSI